MQILAIGLSLWLMSPLQVDEDLPSPALRKSPFTRLAFRLLEEASDGTHLVVPASRTQADLNSDLRLYLVPLGPDSPLPEGEGWSLWQPDKAVPFALTVQAFHDRDSGERSVIHVNAYDKLPLGRLQSIWHLPEYLPSARIELDRTKWKKGERVSLVLRIREAFKIERESTELHTVSWRVEAAQLGLHHRFSTHLVFSSTLDGASESQRWRPNVMAQANWFHNARSPHQLSKFWNWLGAGMGLHLANLDHGPDTVEFGIGANLALWDGLISAGYGYNLSLSGDNDYRFVAINLFDTLNSSK